MWYVENIQEAPSKTYNINILKNHKLSKLVAEETALLRLEVNTTYNEQKKISPLWLGMFLIPFRMLLFDVVVVTNVPAAIVGTNEQNKIEQWQWAILYY